MATSTPVLQDPRAEVQGLTNTTVLAGVVKSSSQAAGQSRTEAREGAAGSIQRWGRDELAATAWSVPAAACRGTGETGETSAFQGEEENGRFYENKIQADCCLCKKVCGDSSQVPGLGVLQHMTQGGTSLAQGPCQLLQCYINLSNTAAVNVWEH